MTRIAVIGPNDEGLRLGVALQSAGADVVGFDLAPAEYSPIPLAHNMTEAATTDVVLSFVSPHLAEKTAQEVAPLLQAGAIYADFTTGTPELKKRLAQHFPDHAYTDASLAAGTIEAAGPAAHALFVELTNLKVSVTAISDVPGDAAARTLIRTLLRNGLAEVLTDTLWAAESLGIEDWAWEDIQQSLTKMDAASAQALIDDAAYNFKPHQIAMQDVVEILAESGYESTMIAPIQFTHGRLMHGKKIPHSQAPAKKWMR